MTERRTTHRLMGIPITTKTYSQTAWQNLRITESHFLKLNSKHRHRFKLLSKGSEFEFDDEQAGDLLMNPKGIIPAFK